MELQVATTRGHGIAVLFRGLDTFNDALLECVSCHDPGQSTPQRLSTGDIDQTERAVLSMASEGVDGVFVEGNTKCLALERGRVVASWIWNEPGSDESVELHDFLHLLARWRQEIIDAGGVHEGPDAATGRQLTPIAPARTLAPRPRRRWWQRLNG